MEAPPGGVRLEIGRRVLPPELADAYARAREAVRQWLRGIALKSGQNHRLGGWRIAPVAAE